MLASAGRACVLTTNSDAPPVPQTTVSTDLLHPFDIITKFGSNALGKDLRVLSGLVILLSVQEPERDFELTGILDDSHNLFNFISGQLTGTLVHVNLGLFTDEIGETTAETVDFGQGKHHIALSLHVCVENTQNVLKFGSLHQRARPEQGINILKHKVSE